jgi:hypothetical protein
VTLTSYNNTISTNQGYQDQECHQGQVEETVREESQWTLERPRVAPQPMEKRRSFSHGYEIPRSQLRQGIPFFVVHLPPFGQASLDEVNVHWIHAGKM